MNDERWLKTKVALVYIGGVVIMCLFFIWMPML